MVPGMSLEDRREAAAREAINGQMGKIVTTLSVALEIFNGTAPGGSRCSPSRAGRASLARSPFTRRASSPNWTDGLPALLVNNSPQIEAARQFFPGLIERKPPEVAAPHAETRLRSGRTRRVIGFKVTKDEIRTFSASRSRRTRSEHLANTIGSPRGGKPPYRECRFLRAA